MDRPKEQEERGMECGCALSCRKKIPQGEILLEAQVHLTDSNKYYFFLFDFFF